jgi:hypothetical protein
MIDPDLKIEMPGRPTKFTSRTPGKCRAYIKKCIEEGRTPFAEEFALELGVSSRTLRNWAHPSDGSSTPFTEIYDILMTVQKLDIKKKGLLGKYETPIAKLLLSAEHDVVERIKKEVTGADGDALHVETALSPEDRKKLAEEITKAVENINSK